MTVSTFLVFFNASKLIIDCSVIVIQHVERLDDTSESAHDLHSATGAVPAENGRQLVTLRDDVRINVLMHYTYCIFFL